VRYGAQPTEIFSPTIQRNFKFYCPPIDIASAARLQLPRALPDGPPSKSLKFA
jgi:hypothetical protein